MTKIAVMGAGSWGTTFAKVLADNPENDVTLWARREDIAEEINTDHRNGDYLPGIVLPQSLKASTDFAEVLQGAEQVYLSVPSQTLRGNLEQWGPLLPKDAMKSGVEIITMVIQWNREGEAYFVKDDLFINL